MRGSFAPPRERFEELALVRPGPLETPCHIWQGSSDKNGSGLFWDGERTVMAHRWLYIDSFGPITPGFSVRRRCADKSCVNPDHLYLHPWKKTVQ